VELVGRLGETGPCLHLFDKECSDEGPVAVAVWFLSVGGLCAQDAPKKKEAVKKAEARAQEQFKKLDADGDGQLTLEEFKGKRKRPEALAQAEEFFKLIDRDEDQKLSFEEFKNKPAEVRFKTMDKNGDGELTFDEFKGRRKKPDEIELAERNFKRIDANNDLKLTLEEFEAAQKKRAERQGGKKRAGKKAQPKRLKAVETQ